jgi:hypothetical protein
MTHKLPLFDGFDCNGNLTGHKCMICLNQEEDCKYQGFYGEGAFLICKKYNENDKFTCELNRLFEN